MRKSTRSIGRETSPGYDELVSRLGQRIHEVVALVAAFHAGPITPESAFVLEKNLRRPVRI